MARYLFTDEQVRRIRREYEQDQTVTISSLAKKYRISISSMSNLLKGVSYPHVPGAVAIQGHGRAPYMDGRLRQEVLMRLENGQSSYLIHRETGVSTSQIHYLKNRVYDYMKNA